MLSYIGLFSSSFTLAVLLWPFVSALLTLPILAFIYHRNRRLGVGSVVTSYVAVLYALGVLAFTLYPMPDDPAAFCAAHHFGPQLDLWKFVPQVLHGSLADRLQLLYNVIFFMPMGFMLQRWAKWRWWVAIPFAFGCSVFIETSQLTGFWGAYPCAYRHFDVDDMLTNTTGAVVGYLCGVLYTHFVPQRFNEAPASVVTKPGFVHRLVAMAIDFLFAFLCYFVVSFGFINLFYKIAKPFNDGTFSLFTLRVDTTFVQASAWTIAAVSFLVFELWIPLAHQGRTLGAMYTHMTVETQRRHGWARAAFYFIRTMIVGGMFLMMVNGEPHFWLVLALMLVFWLVFRRMPWDLIPGKPIEDEEVGETPEAPSTNAAALQSD